MPLKNGTRSEAEEQMDLFRWAAYFPELEWMYAVPNGGRRNAREAMSLKLQGVKAGVSDIALPIPRGKYHGLFVEMKVGKNKPSEAQKEFLRFVNSVGYCGVVCYGAEEAVSVISKYLRGEDLDEKQKEHI